MDHDGKKGEMIFMDKVELDKYSPLHKTGHTSKGDQRKWKIENLWYKADYMGYESLAEVLVSKLLDRSELSYPFVRYEPVQIEYKEQVISGCVSEDFLKKNEILIPVEKLYRQYMGESLAIRLTDFEEVTERIQYMVEQVERITEIEGFGKYITVMLEIDAFFVNEDRHTNNIAVIYNEKTQRYSLSPLFDQGLCIFADTSVDYPLELSYEACLEKIESKPFSMDFDIQLEAAEELYGTQIDFNFNIEDVNAILDSVDGMYSEEICNRIRELLRYQIRKYSYLIKK